MRLLSTIILIGAGCWAASAHAQVSCQVQTRGPLGSVGASPATGPHCGPSGGGYIIPAADIPMCGSTPCYSLTVLPNIAISLSAKATPAWGNSVAQVQQLFPYNILLNFEENPNLDAAITATGDVELARLSTELARNDVSGYTYSIMAYAGQQLSAANLRRLQAAVGPTVFAPAIASMSAATLAAYNAAAVYAPIPLGVYWTTLNPSTAAQVPNDGDLYLYDLLLVDKTASAGETTTLGLSHVSQYVNARVKNVAIVALVIGSVALALQLYDSPTVQALATKVSDWLWLSSLSAYNYGNAGNVTGPGLIQIPNLGNITPPDIDVPVPEMPAIEGDAAQNGASSCTNPDSCPTSAT